MYACCEKRFVVTGIIVKQCIIEKKSIIHHNRKSIKLHIYYVPLCVDKLRSYNKLSYNMIILEKTTLFTTTSRTILSTKNYKAYV